MRLWLNDASMDLDGPLMLSQFIEQILKQEGTYAVALNDQFIPRHAYAGTVLAQDDRIDIIVPMQGG